MLKPFKLRISGYKRPNDSCAGVMRHFDKLFRPLIIIIIIIITKSRYTQFWLDLGRPPARLPICPPVRPPEPSIPGRSSPLAVCACHARPFVRPRKPRPVATHRDNPIVIYRLLLLHRPITKVMFICKSLRSLYVCEDCCSSTVWILLRSADVLRGIRQDVYKRSPGGATAETTSLR